MSVTDEELTDAEVFERERRAVLRAQTVCAWCLQPCRNSNHLFAHLVLRHADVPAIARHLAKLRS
jgi:hypothetical protein